MRRFKSVAPIVLPVFSFEAGRKAHFKIRIPTYMFSVRGTRTPVVDRWHGVARGEGHTCHSPPLFTLLDAFPAVFTQLETPRGRVA